jgi:hypothetical protein
MKFADLLPRGTPTAASLLAAAERADEAAKAASERLANLTEQRLAALIADDDQGLDRLENAITAAQRERDRLEESATELRRRHALTVETDRVAALDALHARGLAAQRRAVELVTNVYPKLAAPLVDLGLELDDLEREIADVNNELRKRGDHRSVLGIDDAARPAAQPLDRFAHGFTSTLFLPHPTDRVETLYPPSKPGRAKVAA